MGLEESIILPGILVKKVFDTIPSAQGFLNNKKNKKRIDLYYKMLESATNYGNIILNNHKNKPYEVGFLSIDQSMNGSGICLSLPILYGEQNLQRFSIISNMLNIVFSSMKKRNFEHSFDYLIDHLDLENLGGFSNTEIKYILFSIVSNLDISYDHVGQNIMICSKMDMSVVDNFGPLNKIVILNASMKFFMNNLKDLLEIFMKHLQIMIECYESIDEISYIQVSNLFSRADFNRFSEPLKKNIENMKSKEIIGLSKKTKKIMDSIIESFDTPIHVSFEEISSSVNFTGLRANGMSLGACLCAIADHTRQAYREIFSSQDSPFFQSMYFLINKSSLTAFCVRVNEHLEHISGQRPEVPDNISESKAAQFVLYSLCTGRTNNDNDICDAFAHNILARNYYDCLFQIVDSLISSMVLGVFEVKVSIHGSERYIKYLKLNGSFFGYDEDSEIFDKSFEDFDKVLASLYNKMDKHCDEMFLSYESVMKYLSSNFSNQINRLFLSSDLVGDDDEVT